MAGGVRNSKWLLPAVVTAIGLSNPFMLVAIGATFGLMVFGCDKRPDWRKTSALVLMPLLPIAVWLDPLMHFFAVCAALSSVMILRRNLFSSVTSSALIGCLISMVLTALLFGGSGQHQFKKIEAEAISAQEKLQEWADSGAAADDIASEEAWQSSLRQAVKILPGELILLMIASYFLAVMLYRKFGLSELPLSLGSNKFNQYRFEDNWVWLIIAGLMLVLFFSASDLLLRVGLNLLFVMGTLYSIRGLAILFFFIAKRGGSLLLRLMLVALCLTPLLVFYPLIGIIDTWMDFRKSVPVTD